MLVDDVAVERRLMRRVLEGCGGFEVTAEAGDGRQAVDMVTRVAPDVILLDLSMPVMDGLEALPLLLDASPGSRILVLSGLPAEQAAEPALQAGAHGYMEKGLHPNEIVSHVTALLAGSEAAAGPCAPIGAPGFASVLEAASSALSVDPVLLHREVLDGLHEGVVVLDGNGFVRAANLSAHRLLGLEDDVITGRPAWNGSWVMTDSSGVDLAPAEHPSMVALHTCEPQLSVTVGIVRSGGECRWLLVNAVPLCQSGSKAHGVVSSFIDVTDAHQAELASERLAAVIELTPDGVDTFDADGTITTWNPGAEALYGFPAAEMIGRKKRRFIPIDRRDEFDDLLRRVDAGERIASFDTVRLRRDGTTIDVSLSISAIRDAHGRLVGYSSITRDVSEHVHLAAALRDSEQLLRQAQEHSSIGMALVSMNGTWLSVNPALCRIVGRSKAELLGTLIQDITHPDDLEAGREDIHRLLAGTIDSHTIEKRYLHADGHVVWVQIDGTVVRHADGTPRHFIAQLQDISERRRSQMLLDLFFHASPDLLCIAGADGRFLRVNPAWTKALGWSAEELTSRPFADFVHPDDLEVTAEEYDGLLGEQGSSVEFENRYRTVSGAYRWLQWNTLALPEEGLIIANARDLTSHKASEATLERRREELATSNADLEQFAYVASHDLSEPLRIISGFASLLEIELDADADSTTGEYLRYIAEGTRRMHSLIQDLLAYSRVGRTGETCEPTDLGRVFADVCALLAPVIAEAGATVEIGSLPVVTAQPALMHRLAQNLVANAVKFRSPERAPRVVVGATEAGPGRWTVRVEDNGIGIEPECRTRVFQMFERLHSRDDYAGTGIGLAICQRIVDHHGGTIAAEGSALGGAAIVVTLPEVQETV
jgi:PAS domain S-box-containing protein